MIKVMQSDNVRIAHITEGRIVINIKGDDTALSIDEFHELTRMTQQFWDANNLWHLTKEAKEDREKYSNGLSLTSPIVAQNVI